MWGEQLSVQAGPRGPHLTLSLFPLVGVFASLRSLHISPKLLSGRELAGSQVDSSK